ncbi:MAG: NADH-quinone oxidoreductase subunit NuoF [Deltaproteobacteria bacterium]|nr:NADH-quinone oxidoreductase subunit NuoF [Deltaproteobacteria bacterium]
MSGDVSNGATTLMVCRGTGCESQKSALIMEHLQKEVDAAGLAHRVCVTFSGCHGFCQQGPIVVVYPDGTFYCRVKAEDAAEIVQSHLVRGEPVERLFYRHPVTGEVTSTYHTIPFYARQQRVVLRNCGHINPERIEDYLALGGYEGLKKALFEMAPEEVIEEVKKSGLRGRGGAGFPTGLKWSFCRKSPGDIKYVICNADEGDPGAFMDRSTMEGDPHTVLEGMIIAAYAIGATDGYIYCRAEYPLAIKRLKIALDQARNAGFLGNNILGSRFSFDIKIKEGAGAFVCGEETALMASIEGRRGMPRTRPPFPAQSGLWGKPTNINNVETFANIPTIITRGGDWFASIGTDQSKGTKVFALTGKVANSGLVEIPMGTPLSSIIFDIGGGIHGGKRFKAVQTGGPSGGCLPASHLNTPVDYETLTEAGSIMGSGGMVVMDEDTCMVDMAKYFLSFTQDESCGKCTPCRLGTKQMLDILENISNGKAKLSDLNLLEELAGSIKAGSLCGLGQTCPNPVFSTLRYFRDEFVEHIKYKKCRAAVCQGLMEAPCSHTCPADIDVPRYVRYIGEGRFRESLAVVREQLPFAAICGLVCFHPCESKCRRGMLDDPIAIRALKRAAWEYGGGAEPEVEPVQAAPPSGKNVAVVGSGPAGLTAAYYLAKKGGHAVTVFEALSRPGGMLRVGIPEYRLPEDVLEMEIDRVRHVGVQIQCSTHVDSVEKLLEQGYDAVFLAVGAHRGIRLGIEGEDSDGVMDAATFLNRVNLGDPPAIGRSVAVVGGGNSAIDACRTSLRLGAKKVALIYRRTGEEMPADPDEIREAEEEGVEIYYLTLPARITRANGGYSMECIRMELGPFDASGRRRPIPVAGSGFSIECDTIIAAIGQMPSHLPLDVVVEVEKGERIKINTDNHATSHPGIFAGGDMVSGPASVIEAVAHGKRAAIAVDQYLGGTGDITEILAPVEPKEPREREEEEEDRFRPTMRYMSVHERINCFKQVELGYTREQAMEEASRCLWCDLENLESNNSTQEQEQKRSA